MGHPSNPSPAEFSERRYGRFGEFFRWKLSKESPLLATYRIWVKAGEARSREEIDSKYRDFATPPVVRIAK